MVKSILTGAAKLALAMILAVAVLAFGAWAVSAWNSHRTAQREAPLATKKDWATQTIFRLPVAVSTSWRERQVLYQVNISDYREDEYFRSPNSSITLQFFDMDGFGLWAHEISSEEMITLTGSDDQGVTGFSWTGGAGNVSADTYGRASTLRVLRTGWSVKTAAVPTPKVPAPVPSKPSPLWRSRANWRRLAVGASEDAVRTALGEPTRIQRFGETLSRWDYGGDWRAGTVSFTRGIVTSWSEPR